MTCRRMGQFSSAGSIRLKKQGVMARASFVLASLVPAYSSGVSDGISRWSCSSEVMRCLSCQQQLFQSASETSDQKPRPADLNSLRAFNELPDGGSSPFADEDSFIVRELYIEWPTCQVESGVPVGGNFSSPAWLIWWH